LAARSTKPQNALSLITASERSRPAENGRTSAVEKAQTTIHALSSSSGRTSVTSASATSIHPISGISACASASLKPAAAMNLRVAEGSAAEGGAAAVWVM